MELHQTKKDLNRKGNSHQRKDASPNWENNIGVS
jgi:hypothetical protein